MGDRKSAGERYIAINTQKLAKNVVAIMPVRNEADRWLAPVLRNLIPRVNEVLVYDDRSSDNTIEIASSFKAVTVVKRQPGEPSFTQHEGRFRQGLWNAYIDHFAPSEGDWVLTIDADEMLVGRLDVTRYPELSVTMPIPEVWGFDEYGHPLIRTDGYWNEQKAPRLFQHQRGGRFSDKPMASGSTPTYVLNAPTFAVEDLWLLHYGYAEPEDREAKYKRYTSHSFGHNPVHIESILQTPTLETWQGPMPL